MDGLEIVLKVEESFGIEIANEEAEKIRTPRQLTSLVLSKVALASQPTDCVTQRAFHKLRRALMNTMQVPRDQIRPDARLALFLPTQSRKRNWHRLQAEMGVGKWPKLTFGKIALCFCIFAGLFFAALVAATISPEKAVGSALVFSLALIPLFLFVTSPLHRGIPAECETVGSAAEYLAQYNRESFTNHPAFWSESEVASIVRKIVSEQLGVQNFSDDADFVYDLGMD